MPSWSLTYLFVSFLLTACVNASSSPALAASANSGCRPPDSFFVQARLDYFRMLLTSTDSALVAARESYGLSVVGANRINLVTNMSTCLSAANALNTQRGEAGTSRLVWVYALGNDYAVVDPDIPPVPGESDPIYLFSHNWTYKVTLVGI